MYSLPGLINCVTMLVSERHVNERIKTSGELNESFAKHFQYVSIHKGAKLIIFSLSILEHKKKNLLFQVKCFFYPHTKVNRVQNSPLTLIVWPLRNDSVFHQKIVDAYRATLRKWWQNIFGGTVHLIFLFPQDYHSISTFSLEGKGESLRFVHTNRSRRASQGK